MTDNLPEKQEQRGLTVPSTGNLLDAITRAALDPNIDVQKMHGLLDVQERMMNKQAEMNFNNALAEMQDKIPRIKKDGRIEHKGNLIGTYATYEAIDKIMRPLLIEHGFGIRFNSKQSGSLITVMGTLSHKDGHSITNEIPLALEGGGAKNSVQAAGSTLTYGKRYIVQMFFNLVFEGEDDDGMKSSFTSLTDAQAQTIKDMIREADVDTRKFLDLVCNGAASVDEMDARLFDKARIQLDIKIRKKNEGTAA
jgi:hypothetical protein